ncbi:hypothetical protein Bca4012_050735 [Brassica carinata]
MNNSSRFTKPSSINFFNTLPLGFFPFHDRSYGNLKPSPDATPISALPKNMCNYYSDFIQAFRLITGDDNGLVSMRDLVAA